MKYLVKFLMISSVFFSILYVSGCGRISANTPIEAADTRILIPGTIDFQQRRMTVRER